MRTFHEYISKKAHEKMFSRDTTISLLNDWNLSSVPSVDKDVKGTDLSFTAGGNITQYIYFGK